MKACLPLTMIVLFAALVTVGCAPTGPSADQGPVWESNTAQGAGGLQVKIEIPTRLPVTGQPLPVRVTATNTSDKPLKIDADTAAPAYVKLYQTNSDGYANEIASFPRFALKIASPWTLAPGESRIFNVNLTVAPDWPQNDPLRLTAEMTCRPDVKPGIYITVLPASSTAKPAADTKKPAVKSPTTQPADSAADNAVDKSAPPAKPALPDEPAVAPAKTETPTKPAPASKPADSDESKAVENLIKPK